MKDHKLASHLFAPERTDFLKSKKVRQNSVLFNAKGFRLLATSPKTNASRLIYFLACTYIFLDPLQRISMYGMLSR